MLQNMHGHSDLLKLDPSGRQELCQQIRAFLIDSVSKTGGHLASNLGVVELTVALETVYDSNTDRLVFDVGHQSYVHKLLTGRQADFARLRQYGGMAGFPKPSESQADAFVAGHASSSVSIGLGMARARTLQNENYNVAVIIGDGACTGGMSYEGFNDAAVSGEKMLIILNDNEMSIAPNVGGFAQHLSGVRSNAGYLGMKVKYRKAMSKNRASRWVYRVTRRIKDRIKRVFLPSTLFENMGLQYLGPVDGNDVESLISLLTLAKEMDGAVVVHVITRKGLGYAPAEEDPSKFHGIGKFDPATGNTLGSQAVSFSKNFGQIMLKLARENPKVCAVTAAMPEGTGLTPFMKQYPHRTFDVGIAEEHAVSMAGGLAKQGMVPVVTLYSTFLQRAYDQIMQDAAMLHLHVVFAIDRAGLVGEDGETHHGIFDVGMLRQMPGMTLLCPASLAEQSRMLSWAVHEQEGPVAIRYPRGSDRGYTECGWKPGDPVICHRQGTDAAIITYGVLLSNVQDAAQILQTEGKSVKILRLAQVEPLPVERILKELSDISSVVIAEEICNGSGIGQELGYALQRAKPHMKTKVLDLGKQFVCHGSLKELYAHYGLDGQAIAQAVKEVL